LTTASSLICDGSAGVTAAISSTVMPPVAGVASWAAPVAPAPSSRAAAVSSAVTRDLPSFAVIDSLLVAADDDTAAFLGGR
jgi:hypothetical protein